MGQLAGGIAHEVNNLLQPISGYAELGLMITESTSETHDFLTEIQTAATHAAEFVRQVERYARRHRPVTTSLAIGPAIEAALARLHRTLPTLEIDLGMAQDTGDVVADREGLEDLLGILLRNAWEAQGGQGCVHVHVQAAPPLDPAPLCQNAGAGVPALDLIVQDHGTGMPPEVATNAFAPFYSTRGAGEGRGLGLAIAQGIVEGWCGQIFLTTGVGRGTEVRVRLPRIGPGWHPETPGACPLGRREACLRQGVRLKALGGD
ncbi:sensor histidine kinase [Pararhodospirillum photometricum]|uniref:histidine kinase n=1 Tax=Pararhodospirillum photometricum DSM 122 TaxID=1150469 RepID=H6SR09_PARPM|nr:ATP-binding protein [Pararhodospirillum photometricum]CCG09731.1 Sensor protein [Pararhodospirillum photometricum DSM 122]